MLTTAVALLAASLKNAELLQQLHENGLQDGLTGCFNRTHAIDSLDIELKRARRTKRPLSVLMFDLDSFKLINDRHGHLCGDAVLAAVGDRVRGATRAGDLKCRYGGDEFIVILPETPLAGARLVCENLRKAMERDPVPWAEGQIVLTASFGVTEMNPGEVDPLAVMRARTRRSIAPSVPAAIASAWPKNRRRTPSPVPAPSIYSRANVIVPSTTIRPLTRAKPSNCAHAAAQPLDARLDLDDVARRRPAGG